MIRIVSRLAGSLAGLALAAAGMAAASTPASAARAPEAHPVVLPATLSTVQASATMSSGRAPGTVQPDTATSCGTGSSSGNVTTCMHVDGSGLHINFAKSSATVNNAGRTL